MSTLATSALDAVRRRLGDAPCSAAVLVDGALEARIHTAGEPLFPVYSLTKTYLAVMVLRTVAAGHLGLHTPVAGFYPDVPAADCITVHHLLSHTAGLPDYGALDAYRRAVAAGGTAWSFDQFADHTYRRGALFAPGAGWRYANTGYALLAGMLEAVWQRPLQDLLADLVTAPLGLHRTRLAATLDDPQVCPSYSPSLHPDGAPQPVKTHYDPGWVWHRLILSDGLESARFLDAVLRRRWLGEELTTAMTALRPVGEQHPPWLTPSYGLGLMGEPDGPHGPVHGHDGGGPGYSTSAYYFTRSRCAVALVAASEAAGAVQDAAFTLARMAG